VSSQTSSPHAVIVTALPLEYHAVRSYLTDITESTHHGTVYETGTFTTTTVTWQVTILETGMGNSNAAVETERAINHYQPSLVLFVGIAGALKDAAIGDVIAATHVYGYEAGKQADEFLARPNVGSSSYPLVQRAKAEARKTTWHTLLTDTPTKPPRVLIGAIAAGEKVLTNSKAPLRDFLHQHYNDALAIEMEGRGFLTATYANHATNSIVIRGISDLLDDKTTTDKMGSQTLAAAHASAFAYHLLATFAPTASTTSDQEILTLGHHAHTSYHGGGNIPDGADTTVTFTLTNQTNHEITDYELRVHVPTKYRPHADQRYPTRATTTAQEFIAREAHTNERLVPGRDVDAITITFHVTEHHCRTSDGEPLTVHMTSGTYKRTYTYTPLELSDLTTEQYANLTRRPTQQALSELRQLRNDLNFYQTLLAHHDEQLRLRASYPTNINPGAEYDREQRKLVTELHREHARFEHRVTTTITILLALPDEPNHRTIVDKLRHLLDTLTPLRNEATTTNPIPQNIVANAANATTDAITTITRHLSTYET
jgi:nucleoside phosphorylase